MFRYWKDAFFARPRLPGLGAMPVNLVGLACFAILGLGHPAFWLLGVAAELTYLTLLGSSRSFQEYIDTLNGISILSMSDDHAEETRQRLVQALPNDAQGRLIRLENQCMRALQQLKKKGAERYVLDSNREALQKLGWSFLKLLTAQRELSALQRTSDHRMLARQAEQLQDELRDEGLSRTVRESKEETLQILHKRQENLDRAGRMLAEVEADLARIEAQVDLAVENAAMCADPGQGVAADIKFASFLLDGELFGENRSRVEELDRTYGALLDAADEADRESGAAGESSEREGEG